MGTVGLSVKISKTHGQKYQTFCHLVNLKIKNKSAFRIQIKFDSK